jgi:N-methylhydantoinase A
MGAMNPAKIRIGIDIGGTFTDFVVFLPGSNTLETFKVLSTPHNPAQAVLEGLARLGYPAAGVEIVHGSTVATNALLERKGAVTALVTSEGFKDVLQIGRQNRPALYDLNANPTPPLIPAHLRFEVAERVDSAGGVLVNLDVEQVRALLPTLADHQVESVAVCFLFSFLHPEHEALAAGELRQAGYFVSASHEILPEYREYERMSTTAINAYVSPVMDRYLGSLETGLAGSSLHIMQSNGGVISVGEARRFGARCVLSGPAGGVVGCQYLGNLGQTKTDRLRLITFDMGGTSTDVALIDREPTLTSEAAIGGLPLHLPVLDIHTIGAGGGSIASADLGGALRVGPQSAGADPGPACYGRVSSAQAPEQVFATVTDANLVLGRLSADYFLGGQMPLDTRAAEWALERLGRSLGLTARQAALGVIAVVNAHMERALRVISVERGYDPQDFTLLSFGGAGGLHAADLARSLGIPRVLVPPTAATLSALGMLAAQVAKDYSQTVMLPGSAEAGAILRPLEKLRRKAHRDLDNEGVSADDRQIEMLLDMRYAGQSYELVIPFHPQQDWLGAFHQMHQRVYGYSRPDVPAGSVEIVNVRLRAVGLVPQPALARLPMHGSNPQAAWLGTRPVCLKSAATEATTEVVTEAVNFYLAEKLLPGNQVIGPAVILRRDTTILLGAGDEARVDSYLNLRIQVDPKL